MTTEPTDTSALVHPSMRVTHEHHVITATFSTHDRTQAVQLTNLLSNICEAYDVQYNLKLDTSLVSQKDNEPW